MRIRITAHDRPASTNQTLLWEMPVKDRRQAARTVRALRKYLGYSQIDFEIIHLRRNRGRDFKDDLLGLRTLADRAQETGRELRKAIDR